MHNSKWLESKVNAFWGEIAPCEHIVHIYENEKTFLDLLTEFIADGLQKNESVVVIATPEHVQLVEKRLDDRSIDLFTLKLQDRFISLDAHHTLARFMIGGRPDEVLFRHAIGEVLARAARSGEGVRAFGEMVAILWEQGLADATLQLEHLWNDLMDKESFTLFCAYPRSGFKKGSSESIMNICGTHAKIIDASENSLTNVIYKDLSFNRNQ